MDLIELTHETDPRYLLYPGFTPDVITMEELADPRWGKLMVAKVGEVVARYENHGDEWKLVPPKIVRVKQGHLSQLEQIEQQLSMIDVSEGPIEFRLNVRHFMNVRIAGYSHLPLDQQLIKWAEGKGWSASIPPIEPGVIRIIKPQALAQAL